MSTVIYSTPFDSQTNKAVGPPSATGFSSLAAAIAAMGPPLRSTRQWAIYGDGRHKVMISPLKFGVDRSVNNG